MKYFNTTAASAATFLQQQRTGKLNTNLHRVYNDLKKHPNSAKNDLIKRLKLPHQTVTSRISVLMDLGQVKVSLTRTTIGNNGPIFESLFLTVTDPAEIDENIKSRINVKIARLKNQIKKYVDIIPADAYNAIQAIKTN